MKDYIAKKAYDKGYDAGVRAGKEPEYVATNPYQKTHAFYGRNYFWQLGAQDGWTGKPRKVSQEEAAEARRQRLAALEEVYQATVALTEYETGHVYVRVKDGDADVFRAARQRLRAALEVVKQMGGAA